MGMHSGYHFGEGLDSYKPVEAYVRRWAGIVERLQL